MYCKIIRALNWKKQHKLQILGLRATFPILKPCYCHLHSLMITLPYTSLKSYRPFDMNLPYLQLRLFLHIHLLCVFFSISEKEVDFLHSKFNPYPQGPAPVGGVVWRDYIRQDVFQPWKGAG